MALTMQKHGYPEVYALIGGFDAWVRAGYPTEQKPTQAQSPTTP